ncbi:hypothetical protein QBC33DRAFT_153832 [Phialemonium atrogriseum]|uniref:CFEM domain-containing protein n=1 Tax=Phialemonium atrogriseum TaxID=1093897 RepID=A0AAJ0CA39_9PEZI|nr:uncharacterized protein QBC33DRAFT_153832 [Phialemonium atrogriseum]KAK1771424.1 hypothetical protein QBC33DRAFT_153832 [Phialemonium atrogriseum]
MKTISVILSVALASFTSAQFEGLPKCATDCADNFLVGGIGDCGTDPKCICNNKTFLSDIACCLVGVCDAKDQAAAVSFAQNICTANGVSVPSVVSCATAAASPTATGSGSATAITTTTGTASGSGAGADSTPSPTGTSPSPTKNFAPRRTAAAGIVGGIVAAVAFL